MKSKQGPIDYWTPAHFLAGMVMRAGDVDAMKSLWLSLAFEAVENSVAKTEASHRIFGGISSSESQLNAATDVLVNMTGWMVMDLVMRRASRASARRSA